LFHLSDEIPGCSQENTKSVIPGNTLVRSPAKNKQPSTFCPVCSENPTTASMAGNVAAIVASLFLGQFPAQIVPLRAEATIG
jgi:hypothetical protein